MKIFQIPVIYEMYGTVKIQAATLAEAIELALTGPSPDRGTQLDDSMTLDPVGLYSYNKLTDEEKQYVESITN